MPAISEFARLGARHGTVLTAGFQSAGTGRDRRPWIAPASSSLLMSVLIKTWRPLNEIPVVSLLIGDCVSRTLAEFNIQSSIKWPNDVLVGGMKICGILVRSSRSVHGDGQDLVVGIGLNLTMGSTTEIPTATNLEAESGFSIASEVVQNRLLVQIGGMFDDFELDDTAVRIARIDDRLAFRGELVSIDAGSRPIQGRLEGIGSDGALIVVASDGNRQFVVSGELQRGPQQQKPG